MHKKRPKSLQIFGGLKVFDNPKSYIDMERLVKYLTQPGDIVLDCFAGSGTTAHGVLLANRTNDCARQFICVQLPEPVSQDTEAGRNALSIGCKTVADVCKERVRRVIDQLNSENSGKLALSGKEKGDRGFRVFKLSTSNFKPWNAEKSKDAIGLQQQLDLNVDRIRQGREAGDILYEVLLKSGFPLTTSVETKVLAGKTIYAISGGTLVVCLDRAITLDLIRSIAGAKPERVVCLDEGFAGNDQLKTNAVQIMKAKGVPSFRTV